MNITLKRTILHSLLLIACFRADAQDTLPGFRVADKGNGRVVVSWKNQFETISQIAVQRSTDSLKRFTTVYSAPSPELPENGYTDKVEPGMRYFYRIFLVLKGGSYLFSESKAPGIDVTVTIPIESQRRDKATEVISQEPSRTTTNKKDPDNPNTVIKPPVIVYPEKKVFIKVEDTLFKTVLLSEYMRFKDSIIFRTKDTLYPLSYDTIQVRRYVLPFVWKESIYVYPDKEGYVVIDLPDAGPKKYDLKIMEEDGTVVLEIRNIQLKYAKLDKANIYHAGWYKFELWEDGKLKERNKILIPKEL